MTLLKSPVIPIFVDMDGTLVKTDIAQELLLQNTKSAAKMKGVLRTISPDPSHTKRYLAENNQFSADRLPYNQEVIDYLRQEKAKGRPLILATASDELVAATVAEHLDLFDEVIASTPGNNLKSDKKLQAIKDHHPNGDFEYIGDSKADIPVWKEAAIKGFVNPSVQVKSITADQSSASLLVTNKPPLLKTLLKAMRPHQWAKNTLVFVPLIFSHAYMDGSAAVDALIAFIALSLCASGVYIVNDLLDIEADRASERKRKRPFAAGNLLPITGVKASIALVVLSLALSSLLKIPAFICILVYLSLTTFYSFHLKHYSTIDVITLTCLYTIRIIAGALAIGAALSPWLLNFSLFFFLSLAYMKRYIELSLSKQTGKITGRNYDAEEANIIMVTGLVNGGLAALTLSLYLNSDFVTTSYASPQILWLICPLMLFWIYRAWLWAKRGKIHEDPVVFALTDRISLITIVLAGATVVASKFFTFGAL